MYCSIQALGLYNCNTLRVDRQTSLQNQLFWRPPNVYKRKTLYISTPTSNYYLCATYMWGIKNFSYFDHSYVNACSNNPNHRSNIPPLWVKCLIYTPIRETVATTLIVAILVQI